MILIYAILIILTEAIGEGLLKRFDTGINEVIFDRWNQWVIAFMFFGIYLMMAFNFTGYFVPAWKIITGFVLVRFATFDVTINLAWGQKWNYYGTTKWYDRIMYELGSFGWMMKVISGIIGMVFLLGYE